jgi:ketosteroid isomerase-like protein
VNIVNLNYLAWLAEDAEQVVGGVSTFADAVTGAFPGGGFAVAGAGAKGDETSTFTDASLKVYDTGTSQLTSANGKATAFASTGNQSSRSYADSVSFAAKN